MWPNPKQTADLVTFTAEFLMENFIFCTVLSLQYRSSMSEIISVKSFGSLKTRKWMGNETPEDKNGFYQQFVQLHHWYKLILMTFHL